MWDYVLTGATAARNLDLASIVRCWQDADVGWPIAARLSVRVKPLLKFEVKKVEFETSKLALVSFYQFKALSIHSHDLTLVVLTNGLMSKL